MEVTSEYVQEGLTKLLSHEALVVTRLVIAEFFCLLASFSPLGRQVEMLNIFLGYEQANRYAISWCFSAS